jgi:hypothetical protein
MNFHEALDTFQDGSIDLLHIDGYHTYEAVKQDFESWLCKMTANGIILLHDIHVRRDSFGVYKYWEEVKGKFKTMEFVGSHGLGIVFLGEIPDGLLHKFYTSSLDGGMPAIQGAFGSISDDIIQNSRNGAILSAVAERDSAVAERDSAVAERDSAVAERDSAVAERDSAVAERDSAVAERDSVLNSGIWKTTKPYRWLRHKF